MRARPGEPRAFYESNVMRQTDECIIWPFGKDGWGYGAISVGSRKEGVHALACLRNGPRPPGMIALHSCNEPTCFNPRHLRWGTDAQNADDRARAGRTARGERHGKTTITADDVRAIRASLGTSERDLATTFGVASSTIHRIRSRESWQHIQ